MAYIVKGALRVADELARFIDEQVLPGTGVAGDAFWDGTNAIFARFSPRNRDLWPGAMRSSPTSTPGTNSARAGLSICPNTRHF